jgi:dCMP deaminase
MSDVAAKDRAPEQLLWVDDKWHNYFYRLTLEAASMSSCLRRKIGCVIVKHNRILSTGYNGAPSKVPHCEVCPRANLPSGANLEKCVAVHAEQNAMGWATRQGIALDGATAYVTVQPCSSCMKSLITAGIVRVIYMGGYPDDMTLYLAEQAGVEMIKLERIDGQ